MSVKRGKLYDSVVLNLNRSYCQPNTYDTLKMAEKKVREIKTMDELHSWVSEWFGETE
jgi:hypothetical protein